MLPCDQSSFIVFGLDDVVGMPRNGHGVVAQKVLRRELAPKLLGALQYFRLLNLLCEQFAHALLTLFDNRGARLLAIALQHVHGGAIQSRKQFIFPCVPNFGAGTANVGDGQ